MNIGIFEAKKWEKPLFRKHLKNHRLTFCPDPLGKDTVFQYKNIDIAVVFIYSKLTKTLLQKLPRLKFIATKSTGFDHIDLAYCRKKGIVVSNVPFYGENTVAEHTFALILSLSRNIHKSYFRTLRNDFSIEGLKGFDLKNKTLGVIGTGHIGLHVIKIAKGFGMHVLAYDVQKKPFLSEVLGFRYVDLITLLKKSDIITLHVPYNSSTHHLIDKKTLSHIKKGAILINTSRGGVVDTDALIEALDKKILSGAGLDVIEGEEYIKEEKQLLYDGKNQEAIANLVRDHILLSKDNVVYTPHIAFYSQEALERILSTTVENILAFLENCPKNTVP